MADIARRLDAEAEAQGREGWAPWDEIRVRPLAGRVILVADASNVDAAVPRYAEGVLTVLRCDATGALLALGYTPTHYQRLPRLEGV